MSFDGYGECFVETGNMRADSAVGDFYAEPVPNVAVRQPSIAEHFAKVLFDEAVAASLVLNDALMNPTRRGDERWRRHPCV